MGSLKIRGKGLSQEPPAPGKLSNTGRISLYLWKSKSVCGVAVMGREWCQSLPGFEGHLF